MQTFTFRAMGCDMALMLDSDSLNASDLRDEVQHWLMGWEQQFSRFRADSELSRLNDNAGQAFQVSEPMWQVLQQSLCAVQASRGLVTPVVLDALQTAGYDRSFEYLSETMPSIPAAQATVPIWRFDVQTVIFDEAQRKVTLPLGMRLDLGGVVKGWCADKVVRRLAVHAPVLFDAGGDVAVSGPMADGGTWWIGLMNPLQPEHDLHQVGLLGGGIATSGRDYRQWRQGERLQHHIIDPRTGASAQTDVLSATVLAASASEAEMVAKAILIMGAAAGLAWVEAQPQWAACIVTDAGEVMSSRRFMARVWSETAS